MLRNRPFRRNCTPAGGHSPGAPLTVHIQKRCADGRRHAMRRLSRPGQRVSVQHKRIDHVPPDQFQSSPRRELCDEAVVTLAKSESEQTALTCRQNLQARSPSVSAIFGSKPVTTSVRLRLLVIHADGRAYTLVGVQSRSRRSFWVLSSRPAEPHNENLFAQVSECLDRVLGPGARWRTGEPDEDSATNA